MFDNWYSLPAELPALSDGRLARSHAARPVFEYAVPSELPSHAYMKPSHSSLLSKDSCHRNQRSMSLGGPAHESLLQKTIKNQQPAQTVEMSRGPNGE